MALVGLFTGIIAGMFGVGGGFFLTPFLMYGLGIPSEIAIGSALSQKCGTSISSFLKYRKVGLGEPRFDLLMIGGSLTGAFIGTKLLVRLSEAGTMRFGGYEIRTAQFWIDLLFFIILSITGVYMGIDAMKAMKTTVIRGDVTIPGPLAKLRIPPYVDLPNVGLKQVSLTVIVYLALILGILTALLGIGGGVVFTPVLMYGYGLSARHAAGTGIMLLFVTVMFATFQSSMEGFVYLPLAFSILVGSGFGTIIGTEVTTKVKNRYLRLVFSILILGTCGGIVFDVVRNFHHI